ncbi:MAG: RNA polymerase sigma factor [Acidimicrobiia bacterium]
MSGTIDARHAEGVRQSPSERDAGLIEDARRGDVDAWSAIVQTLGPRVQGYARGKGISDAEDVMQDVFLAAAHGIGTFQGDESAFRSWIFSIAYRQIANRYRNPFRNQAELPPTLVDPDQQTPDDEIIARETSSEALAALDVLEDTERDVVLLRVLADLDTEQVASAVGKEPGNVRVIQSRALAKVRDELQSRGYGGESEVTGP